MKYLIWGYYGFGNLGDELMLKNIAKRIKNKDSNSIIYTRCFNTPENKEILPLPIEKISIPFPFLSPIAYILKVLWFIPKIDILVIGGGTLFLDKGKHNFSMLILTIVVFWAKMFGKKIYITGVGIDLLTFPLNLVYLRCILRSSNLACLRDDFSYTIAKYLANKENILRTSDIIFDASFVSSITKDCPNEGKYLIISLSDYYKTWHSPLKRELLMEKSCLLIEMILKKYGDKYRILLCPFQKALGERDYEFLEKIRNSIMEKNKDCAERIDLKYIETEDDIREIFPFAVFTIGMRYHALVLSAIFKKPFLGIDIETKIKEICIEFDMPFVNIDDFLKKGIFSYDIEKLFLSNISDSKLKKQIEMADANFKWLR